MLCDIVCSWVLSIWDRQRRLLVYASHVKRAMMTATTMAHAAPIALVTFTWTELRLIRRHERTRNRLDCLPSITNIRLRGRWGGEEVARISLQVLSNRWLPNCIIFVTVIDRFGWPVVTFFHFDASESAFVDVFFQNRRHGNVEGSCIYQVRRQSVRSALCNNLCTGCFTAVWRTKLV